MKEWEHLFVGTHDSTETDDFTNQLNALGSLGWEAVGFGRIGNLPTMGVLMKRRKKAPKAKEVSITGSDFNPPPGEDD